MGYTRKVLTALPGTMPCHSEAENANRQQVSKAFCFQTPGRKGGVSPPWGITEVCPAVLAGSNMPVAEQQNT